MHHRTRFSPLLTTLALLCAAPLLSCGPDFSEESLGTEVPWEPKRPVVGNDNKAMPNYEGDNVHVQEAQERFRTGLDLHRKVIWRTCTPNGGVCHNRKEYPDLHTPANFLQAIGAPCNLQPGEYRSVFDRCERPGDLLSFEGQDWKGIEIGHVVYNVGEQQDYGDENKPTAESIGLHVYLHDPLPDGIDTNGRRWRTGQFSRTFVNDDGKVRELSYATLGAQWWVLSEDRKHVFAEVRNYQAEEVKQMVDVGIVQGDHNRNGVFGAREDTPLQMLEPGKPANSYLIARIRGELGEGVKIPGSRMPLANQPLTIAEMTALFCFVEGLGDLDVDNLDPNLTWEIDYKGCSFARDPEELNLLGEGVTWSSRVQKILQANCGGCHSAERMEAGLDLNSEDAFANLLENSTQLTEMKLIEPGDPDKSYLWLKLIGDSEIVGLPMPFNPLTGVGKLSEAELGDIKTWIANGAVENE